MTIYAVYRNSDMNEGRGPFVLHSLYESKYRAQQFASKQPGVMGRPGPNDDWAVRDMTVITEAEIVAQQDEEKERQALLGTLTARQKMLLGVKA